MLIARSPWAWGTVVAEIPETPLAAVDAAVVSMAASFPGWAARSDRAERLRGFAAVLSARRAAIVDLLVREAGKCSADAEAEADLLPRKIAITLDQALARTPAFTPPTPGEATIAWRPRGVAAVLGPFNFPLHLLHGLVVPALAVGCTVVAKPSERCPALGELYRACLADAGLAEVATVVQGGREVAGRLIDHPAITTVAAVGGRPTGDEPRQTGAPAGLVARPLLAHGLPFALALRHVRPRFGSVLVRDALVAGPRTLLRASFEVANADVRPDLRRVATPTLVLVGGRDPLVPPAVAEVVKSELPGTQVVVLEGAAHVPMFDRPHEFAEAVLDFLDQASSDSKERTMRPRSRGRE